MTTTQFTTPTVGQGLWWNTLIGGIASIVIGALLLAVPVQAMIILAQLVGLYFLILGLLALVSIFVDRSNWGWKLLGGGVGVLAGLAIVQHPLWSAFVLPASLILFMAFAGIILGFGNMIMAFMGGGFGAFVLGLISLGFGLLLLSAPLLAATWVPFVLGIWGVVVGAAAVIEAIRERPAASEGGATDATRRVA